MKFAVPVVDGRLCSHFGHCQQFAVVDVAETGGRAMRTTLLSPPPHEPGVLPQWLHQQGVNMVIAGGMGHRRKQLLTECGVKVLVGAPPRAPEELVAAYLEGRLQDGANVCDH